MTSAPKKTLQKPKAILFDWDNTLVDSWAIILDAMNFTLKKYNMKPWTLDETRQRVRKSMRNSFPQLFGEEWQQAANVFYSRFDEIHITMLNPLEGAAEMLSELSERGLYLAVVSNKRGEYLRKEASHLGWDRHFSRLVGALDAKNDKPSSDPVELALSDSKHKRGGGVWFVGDADIDLECAINADLAPILLRPEAPKVDEFKKYSPICHIVDCQALSKLVASL